MANPTIANLTLNAASYSPGAPARLSFDVADADTKSSEVTVTVADESGATGTGTIILVKVDNLTVTVTDPDRTWTKDNTASTGNHYEFTAVA